jgi:hypothetical protein
MRVPVETPEKQLEELIHLSLFEADPDGMPGPSSHSSKYDLRILFRCDLIPCFRAFHPQQHLPASQFPA